MGDLRRSPSRRAAVWAAILTIAGPVLSIGFIWIAALVFRNSPQLEGRIENIGIDLICIFALPGLLLSMSLVMAFSPYGVHGMDWPYLVPAPFVNWAFYYFLVCLPFFRWRERRKPLRGSPR
jgi:hypothetical protein